MSEPVAVLDHVTIARGGHDVVRDLSWTIREGETWAIVGPIGSGKTMLAEALAGRLPIQGGSLAWPLIERLRATGRSIAYASEVVRHVAFKEESRLFSNYGHYYQQRFEFADEDEPLTLEDYLRSGMDFSREEVAAAARRLGIADRLDLSFIKLSNGQTRRARIARALLSHPELLILDDPFLGVDAAGRDDVARLLGGLVRQGQRLVLICPRDAVPGWVTNVLECGTWRPRPVNRELQPSAGGGRASANHGQSVNSTERGRSALVCDSRLTVPVIELHSVTVAHGGRTILSGINWTVRAGERWALTGPNGSGKTSLLSLLCGDHPQAYSNDVRLFGQRRGTGESIWDVKRRVGLVSPEFHLYFTEPLTAERAAATGFFDTVTDRTTTPEQDGAVRQMFAEFGTSGIASRPFRSLSTGEQRLVQLVRALVKRPPLVIHDEPFQGLDADTIALARDWIDRNLSEDQTLLFVSHHEEEIPRTVARRLRLNEGRVEAVV
jgi:molybdate transport system ATP-binding protein